MIEILLAHSAMIVCLICILIQGADDSSDVFIGVAFFLLLLGLLCFYIFRRLRLRLGTSSWTMIEATIQSEFATNPGDRGVGITLDGSLIKAVISSRNVCRAVLQYSYKAAGEFYSGCFMLGGNFTSREDARAAAQPWLGKTIFIRYNPDKPYLSVYLRADGAPKGSRSLGDQPPASDDVITLTLK